MIDLHSHSTMSDGTDAPGAGRARSPPTPGLDALALTDHDTLEHLPEARAAADEHGVRLVPGCEISCELGRRAPGSMHLLVYFVDDRARPAPGPAGRAAARSQRAQRADPRRAARRTASTSPTTSSRPKRGRARSVDRASPASSCARATSTRSRRRSTAGWRRARPAYFERPRLDPEEAIELTHGSGGVCADRAPGLARARRRRARRVRRPSSRDAGLDGLECEYARYTPEERAPLHELAARHGLAPTGGSDYHGENKPGLRRRRRPRRPARPRRVPRRARVRRR